VDSSLALGSGVLVAGMAGCLKSIQLYHFHPPISAVDARPAAYNRAVSETPKPAPAVQITPIISALKAQPQDAASDSTRCERCGAEMYRMHAVWRCTSCRFKTDCCGW
jgi:hypothetical protein